jgi:zinc transport system substrate-binding protein
MGGRLRIQEGEHARSSYAAVVSTSQFLNFSTSAFPARLLQRLFFFCCLLSLLTLPFTGCERSKGTPAGQKRLTVITTLFPLFDFARNVGGDRADVSLLLPPGVEPHSFEPRPRDILRINEADVFVYTGSFMEPWAGTLIKGIDRQKVVVVDSSEGAVLLSQTHTGEAGHDGHHDGEKEAKDPHIWLDLGNARKMVDNIVAGFVKKDPAHKEFYEGNARAYEARLQALDEKFKQGLADCKTRLFVHGGHYAFNYLARRYNLNYVSVYGFSPNAEPSPKHVAEIVQTLRRYHAQYIFYEELIQPRLAETVARETGATMLPLNGGHNVTREEMERGVTFISLLEQDLRNLSTGLQCR